MTDEAAGSEINRSEMRPGPKVVLVCQLFYPELVNTGQTLTELAEELSDLGIDLTIVASQPTVIKGAESVPRRLQHHGMRIFRTWSTRFPKTAFLGKLLNQLSFFVTSVAHVLFHQRDAQLLILTNPPYLPLLGWFCHLIRRQPFGLLLFDIMPEQAELLQFVKPGGLIARLWRHLNRISYLRATYVIVLSRDMLNGAIENANLAGTSEESECVRKTRIIHVWSDDRIIQPMAKSDSSEAYRLDVAGKFVVQYSGNHGRFHDIESVLEIARLLRDRSDIVFQFIGEGQKKRLVAHYRQRHGLRNIYESSYCPKELLSDSLAMADLGVVAQLPGQERVCYPSKLLGIMAAGRATLAICTPDCEMARMLKTNLLGFVVPNRNAEEGARVIVAAAGQQEKLAAMGVNARNYLRENFSLRSAANGYLDLIRRVDETSKNYE